MSGFIPVAEPDLRGNELAYVTECVNSTWISSLGDFILRFEKEFARFCGTRQAIAVANGTAALHLTLAALGIRAGDEVIVPTLTFVATANAVSYTGATVVFADSERATWNVDPDDIARRITPRTKAIIVVHLYGHPAEMDPVIRLARAHGLYVIEDAAEAHGAEYKGRRVGSIGDVGTFSFYGNKIITTGEGGMLTLDDENLAKRAAFLKDHAMSVEKRYWHPDIGYNYRMTNLQAALGVAQLERIDEMIAQKRSNAALYSNLLKDMRGITLPPEAPWAKSVYWMYSILVNEDFPLTRDQLMAHLKVRGIDSRPFFHPIHTLPPYQSGETYPIAKDLARRGINLPSSTKLTPEDIGRVAAAIHEAE